VLDLFAGCGGLTEGFHQFRAGGGDRPVFRSVGAVEWDKAAAASYAMNFGQVSSRTRYFEPPTIICQDIVGWEPDWKPGEIDVVVGGPPCQGFSGLNRNRTGAERNTLWQEFIRVVVALQPKVFVIENVDRFVRSSEFADLQERIGNGDLKDYQLVEAPGTKRDDSDQQRARRYLLNSADYGAIQARRRAIVIGVRGDADLDPRVARMQYPEPTHLKAALVHQAMLDELGLAPRPKAWATVDRLFEETSHRDLAGTDLPYGSITVPGVDVELPGPFRTDQLHFTRSPEAVSLARYEAIPAGGNRKDLRGRYGCWVDDGSFVILERQGPFRGEDGALLVEGDYVAIDDEGEPTRRKYTLTDCVPLPAAGRSARSKSEIYRGTVIKGRAKRQARLEYLSTPAWDRHDAGAGDVMGRMRRGEPSVTIRTEFFKPEKGRYLHPSADRPITHYEAAKMQGFPDDFRWCGSKTAIARQIGNAVPIPLGTAIAGAIYEYLRSP
jgi:DNA (cytosine-5)-methyltransferase 1